ncbi:TIGR02221 family CRISPR-associated protein [Bacteroides sp.]
MAKVLISFLGTAQPNIRQYRVAQYRFNDGSEFQSSFIASALRSHYQIDKMILLGTVKSMWEEVYRTFSNDINEQIYFELSEHCLSANANSKLYLPHQNKIEEALGNNSKAILIKYGLNEEEIQYNSTTILQLEHYLSSGDELYIDITHSFRSLPLFLMNSLIYMQNVSRKHINICHISYGMLDVTAELGYTPVVELKSLLQVNDWISGAYSFFEFGNAYKISRLLEEGYKDISQRLIKFSNVKNLNHLHGIEMQIQELQAIKNRELPLIAQLVVFPVIEEFLSHFKNCSSHSRFQYKLACWYYEKRHYSSAYIVFVEAIISYICECNMWDETSKEERENAKKALLNNNRFQQLRHIYIQVNNIRKQIAHNLIGNQGYESMIHSLKNNLSSFHTILNS